MRYRNILKMIGPVVVAIIPMPALVGVGYAQEVISPVDTMTLPDRFVVPVDSTTGWLILYGELVSAPYEIVVEDSNITINGLSVYRKPETRKDKGFKRDSLGSLVYELRQKFWPLFHAGVEQEGLEAARAWAVEFFNEQPFVDSAYFKPPSDLCVKYRGLGAQMVYLLEPQSDPPKPPEGWIRDRGRHRALRLAASLERGCLVITQGGFMSIIAPPDAEPELNKIKKAAAISNLEARVAALQGIVQFKDVANNIAKRFLRE